MSQPHEEAEPKPRAKGAEPSAEPPRPRRPDAGQRARHRRRAFYSIGEVCEMFDLKPHVLRYWETQFDQLRPSKNRAGNRVYQSNEVEVIALIKRLVHDERYTIEGARRRVDEMRAEGSFVEQSSRSLERAYLRSLESELESLLDLLNPTPVDRGTGAG